MSDALIRELERQVVAQPEDIDLRQRLLAAYVRTGVCNPKVIGELAVLGDEAALALLPERRGRLRLTDSKHKFDSRSKKFYIACAFAAFRLAYSEWVEYFKRRDMGDYQLGDAIYLSELFSFMNSWALSFLSGQGTNEKFEYSGYSSDDAEMSFREALHVISSWYTITDPTDISLQVAAISLHRALSSSQIIANSRYCMLHSSNALGSLQGKAPLSLDSIFEVLKPEISRIILPPYLPPVSYLPVTI